MKKIVFLFRIILFDATVCDFFFNMDDPGFVSRLLFHHLHYNYAKWVIYSRFVPLPAHRPRQPGHLPLRRICVIEKAGISTEKFH